MPAIDFPASPSVNDEYSFEGRTWLWNGTGWEVKSYPAALQLGSASAPSLYFTGDPNTGIYSPGADQVAISTNGTERLFVDANGNVGIGTSSTTTQRVAVLGASTDPVITLLESTSGSSARLRVYVDNTAGITFNATNTALASKNIIFTRGASTESARIDSSGRFLVGTSTALANVYIAASAIGPALQIEGNSGSTASLSITRQTGAAANIILQRGVTGTPAADGHAVGQINFNGFDGTNFINAAQITAVVDGTPGANDMPGRLVFSTTANGASSPTEVMRLTSNNYLRMASTAGGIQFNGDTAAANALDDYESGSFTPRVDGSTTAGTATYTFQSGFYRKVGTLVHFQIHLVWSAHTGTGTALIRTLPFVSNQNNVAFACLASMQTVSGAVPMAYSSTSQSTTINLVYYNGSAGGLTNWPMANAVSGVLSIAGTYATDVI